MRDGSGEACAELLVGREVARVAQVEQRLGVPVHLVGHLERRSAAGAGELLGKRHALDDPLQRLPRAAARGEDAAVRVEDDDDLAALLDQPFGARGLEPQRGELVAAATATADPHRRVMSSFTASPGLSYAAVPRVLIVEDDDVIADGMARHLAAAGFEPIVVAQGEQGLARLRFERPDVCVLDLMLPGLDGWKLIETARAEGIGTPIVVVSARGTEHDRVHALEIGADDYLVKPFSMKELVARVKAVARRGARAETTSAASRSSRGAAHRPARGAGVRGRRRTCGLTPTEFRLLYALAIEPRPGRHARRAAAAHLGPPRGPSRPDRRRLRPQAAREGRPARLAAHLHPDALRRRLRARAGAEDRRPAAGRLAPGSSPRRQVTLCYLVWWAPRVRRAC